jgi:hypothetical protein
MSNADKVALKQATVACKAEVKGMKVRWPASRKYVKNCNHKDGGSQRPSQHEHTQVRSTVNVKSLRKQRSPEWGCDPMY